MIRLEPKRPAEARDYAHDWSDFLGEDTIASQVTTATGVTVASSANDDTGTTFSLSGGTSGTVATITQTITTDGGNTETEIFILAIQADEPVSLAEAKAQCRVLDDSEDALLAGYISAAREWVEGYTNRILLRRQLTQTFDCFGDFLRLYRTPVISVDDITYSDSDGDDAALEDFIVRGGTDFPARIFPAQGECWPTLGTNGAISVTYTAGYAEGGCPERLRHAILMLVAHWHSVRGSVSIGNIVQEIPLATTALCDPFRVPGL